MDNRGIVKISYFYSAYLGGRYQCAGVSLFLQPADRFVFASEVDWEGENFESAIQRGVLDGLADIGLDPAQGIHVQLMEVIDHPVDASEKSFNTAARIAIRTRKDLSELR